MWQFRRGKLRPPPPAPPHKGEGSTPSVRHDCASSTNKCAAVAAVALGAMLAAPSPAPAQDYPARAVKIIVPFPAGGTADVMPRIFADWLAKKWGHPVVLENRTGAARH